MSAFETWLFTIFIDSNVINFNNSAPYYFLSEECRGIGGLFFDDLDEKPIEECFNFIADAGHAVLPGYIPSIERWRDEEYGDEERNWQLIRRGR